MTSPGGPLVPATSCTGCGHPFDDDDRFCASCRRARKDMLPTAGRPASVGATPSVSPAPVGTRTRRPSAPATVPTGVPAEAPAGAPTGGHASLDGPASAKASTSSPASSGKDGAIAWARSLMGRTDWVILDTETTGLGSTDVVIQIGVTDHRGVTLVDTLVRPAVAIGYWAQAVHGISARAVAGARDFPAVLPELRRAIGGKTVVAYNAPFDRRLLDQTASRHGVALPAVEWDCAMQWYKRYLGVRSAKLPGAIHGATGDCLATLAVIRTMAGPAGAVTPAAISAPGTRAIPVARVVIPRPAPADPRTWTVIAHGEGTGAGEFSHPSGIAVDGDGTVWVAEWANQRIQAMGRDGQWTVVAGKPGGGPGAIGTGPGEFSRPSGIAVDGNQTVWVADTENHRIQSMGRDGQWNVVAGKPGGGPGAIGTGAGEFSRPSGIAVDGNQTVWVAESGNHRIQAMGRDGQWSVVAGKPGGGDGARGPGAGEFRYPSGIAVDGNQTVWVADVGNHRIQAMGRDGQWNVVTGQPRGGDGARGTRGRFNRPLDVAVDGNGTVWVADTVNNRIHRYAAG